MKHLSNIYNPKLPNAYLFFEYSHVLSTKEEQWAHYLEWVNENQIGLPQATDRFSVRDLVAMGMVGVYSKDEAQQ